LPHLHYPSLPRHLHSFPTRRSSDLPSISMSSCSHETPARVAESQEVATPAPRSRGLAERLRLDAPDETLHGGPRLLEPRLVGDMALLGAAITEIGEGHHQALRLGSS